MRREGIISRSSSLRARFIGVGGLFGAAVVAAGASWADAGPGPFTGLAGVWGGTGTVTYASGTRERLRCRVQYTQGNDSNNLSQALRCASDSYNFQINAYFVNRDGSVSGHWEEKVNQISGSISGSASAGHIDGLLNGPGFKAKVSVQTTGNSQTVTISAEDQQIREVAVDVRRSGG